MNQVWAYVLVLLAGGFLSQGRQSAGSFLKWLRSRFVYTVEIDNNDSAFNWVRQWLAAKKPTCRYLTAHLDYGGDGCPGSGTRQRPRFYLAPRGVCAFRQGGRRFVAWVTKEAIQGTISYREMITLTCFGNGAETVKALLSEAYDLANGIDGKTVEVWMPDGQGWQLATRRPARPLSSLALEPAAAAIVGDAKRFLAAKAWYQGAGIPWRRGYLLYGPPGNGKSSLAHALASEIGTNINVLNLSGVTGDDALANLMLRAPKGNILLLEDIDAAWNGREAARTGGVTFSGLLNAIDGAAAPEGRILVMTTNHPDKLDPALTRPGRADVHVELPNATAEQATQLYRHFFSDRTHDAQAFGATWQGKSMAAIQEHLLTIREKGSIHLAA